MSSAGLIIQVLAIVTGLLATALFVKSNLTIMKFRQLTSLGLLALWTGSIDTSKLIIVDGRNNKVVEKELINAILLHKRARIVVYAAVVLNILALVIGHGVS
ncbi:hypothetical protein MUGA111182_20605 [Mucilaginibacter galii]|uniref:Uncharacterized protein n=1 Tax=Mucilaginibacter galii TaxID=2005073 RepID=A0A917JE12_9SPHI|nr:hypothetical protein [Mucilaginibacter galii]GGI52817.1 hypothetical protein GCM10011425_40290 [Mucilaginibacter galii]